MNVKNRIELLIVSLKITKKAFASAIEVSPGNVSDWINQNRNANPSTDALIRISEIYKVNLNWLLSGIGSMFLTDQNTQEPNNKNSSTQKEIDYYIKRVKELETQTNELKKNIQSIEDSYNQATDNFSQERLKNSELFNKNQMLNDELTSRLRELVECKDLVIKLSLK